MNVRKSQYDVPRGMNGFTMYTNGEDQNQLLSIMNISTSDDANYDPNDCETKQITTVNARLCSEQCQSKKIFPAVVLPGASLSANKSMTPLGLY